MKKLAETVLGAFKSLGFLQRLFAEVYSKSNMLEMFKRGYESREKELSELKAQNSELIAKNKDLTNDVLRLEQEKENLSKTNEEVNSSSKIVGEELTKSKAEVSRLKTKIAKLEANDCVGEIKALKQKISDNDKAASKKLNSELKKCTDDFMKKLNKKDKEIETLKKQTRGGSKVGIPKLTCASVKEIRAKHKTVPDSKTLKALSDKYDVSTDTMRRVIKKETYKKC